MQYKKESCVICLDDPKQAALYYDRVVPVTFPYHGHGMSPEKYVHNFTNLLGENLHCDIKTVMSISEQIWNLIPINTSLLAAYKQEPCSYVQWVEKTFGFTHSNKVKDYCKSMDKLFSEVEINETKFPDILSIVLGLGYIEDIKSVKKNFSIRLIIDNFSSFLGISQAPVLLPSECLNYIKATEDDLSFSIANFPLVDTKKAQWDQIFEFRKDKAARKKLRNLLLFFHINYEDKSFAFIEDDLNKRLDEYHIAIKDWGFETRNSIFSALMDSQSLLATYAAILGAILLKEPIAQTFSALAGATLNIGKIILTYDKQKHAFHKLKRDHDLAYIIEAREHLENTS